MIKDSSYKKLMIGVSAFVLVAIIGIAYADFTDNLKSLIFQLFFSSKLLLPLINLLFFQRFINKRKIENAIRNINNEMEGI